MEFGKGDL
jgi:hypothetical protein